MLPKYLTSTRLSRVRNCHSFYLFPLKVCLASGTPPLTPGSGYSSTSPGPVSPLSRDVSPVSPRPSNQSALVADTSTSPVSPLGARLPFFDKIRNKLPENVTQINTTPDNGRSRASSSASGGPHSSKAHDVPPSPSSGSEYGLAYADSTDYEDEDDRDFDQTNPKGKNLPPPLPLTGTPNHRPTKSQTHQKDLQSVSSASGGEREGRNRSNSALVAQALGLSQTHPSAYGKLGGPPTRSGRSSSTSSIGSKSAYSRASSVSSGAGLGLIASTSSAAPTGRLERAMETLLEDVDGSKNRPSLMKSKSTGKQAYFDRKDETQLLSASPTSLSKSLPSRSNTVGVPYSPETKPVKLPARARTERERSTDFRGTGHSKRPKTCVRCERRIEDGRWIQVDGGGVLCEKCWKNMYLPKVRALHFPKFCIILTDAFFSAGVATCL